MRQLDRNSVAAPACLGLYRHGANNWGGVRSEHKAEIRACLHAMQGSWCAYCEGSLDTLGQHIEHFEPKGQRSQGTFSWPNLFWSCDQVDSCGHFKDNGAGPYALADLLNPCVDDPEFYFRFRSDGTISTRRGLSDPDRTRAVTTLRVFNLDPENGRLRRMRKSMLKGFDYVLEGVEVLTRDELLEYIAEELVAAKSLPFQTAIRHVLTEPTP